MKSLAYRKYVIIILGKTFMLEILVDYTQNHNPANFLCRTADRKQYEDTIEDTTQSQQVFLKQHHMRSTQISIFSNINNFRNN